ncbi:membrane protein insertion efficiency factor YidD [Streptomyces sp. NBC_00390]|uniref:membrane protein insertion efficiency factor YidD n=1 Tax=Streptomyces sp. NBC_00390 TaxID=2975736 RepID=UPI002E24E1BD
MSKPHRTNRPGQQKKRNSEEEGCCAGALDTWVGCSRCCPATWLAVLLLALCRPSAVTARSGEDPAAPRPAGRAAAGMYAAVRHYRTVISPARPACCTYTPTCSTYAVQALHRHGALRGGRLILARLLRCRPQAARRRGFRDPVPD